MSAMFHMVVPVCGGVVGGGEGVSAIILVALSQDTRGNADHKSTSLE